MKYGIRAGHTLKTVGAVGFVKEYDVVRAIKPFVVDMLKTKHTVIDCQPDENSGDNNLTLGINIAHANNVDIFASIHANAGKGKGVEVLLYDSSSTLKAQAQAICNNMASLGFVNRGIKYRPDLGELKNTNMPAMIIETFFVDTQGDCDLYNKVGAKAIGEAIAKGLDSTVATVQTQPTPTDTTNTANTATVTNTGDSTIKSIQSALNSRYSTRLDVDGIFGNLTKTALIKGLQREIGTTADGIFGINTYTVCGNKTNLKNGSSGKLVYILQATLYCLGFDCKGIDSIFGANTQSAVKALQQAKGLSVDGIAGKNTFAKLFGYK